MNKIIRGCAMYIFRLRYLLSLILLGIFISCQSDSAQQDQALDTQSITSDSLKEETGTIQAEYQVEVKELLDSDYPDNPDIGYRSTLYQTFSHKNLTIRVENDSTVTFEFQAGSDSGSAITLENLNIETFMIGVPDWIKDDPYLTYLSLLNQEWNRQQVKFVKEDPELVIGDGVEGKGVVRVDLARNCLNSGLWEIAMWRTDENEENQVYYHGWFDFPMELYSFLVSRKNNFNFEEHRAYCETWVEPSSEQINLSVLRTVDSEIEVKSFMDEKNGFYPKKAARLKKYKNIIYPQKPTKISEFLTDKSEFATFSPPGYYNTRDPRKTELGRFNTLEDIKCRAISNPHTDQTDLFEVELLFSDASNTRKTHLIFGGISRSALPTLAESEMNDGYKMPMGIANHSFYETYDQAVNTPMNNNPYYAFILNQEEKWLDSHSIGVDGPLMHWDAENENKLHIWLLSFERHAFVGHYTIQF